ncbi:hypothetical protein AN395_02231 [Pseudoalteromonas sp. P1-30]|nr:hypothetical protein AN395_02231 [Pseudoalteromonas sp. P1-30]
MLVIVLAMFFTAGSLRATTSLVPAALWGALTLACGSTLVIKPKLFSLDSVLTASILDRSLTSA